MMTMSVGRPFSVADLEAMPDDGRRYELIDGELLVTPAPGWAHQEASITLTELLRAAPSGLPSRPPRADRAVRRASGHAQRAPAGRARGALRGPDAQEPAQAAGAGRRGCLAEQPADRRQPQAGGLRAHGRTDVLARRS